MRKPKWSAALEFAERRDGDGHGEGALGRLLATLEGVHEHFDGLTGVGRDKNRGSENAAADPSLTGLGQNNRMQEPCRSRRGDGQLAKKG